MAENPPRTRIGRGHFVNEYKAKLVELTGFEPVTSSLRKMRTKRCDQGICLDSAGLWSGCATSDVSGREMAQETRQDDMAFSTGVHART
jgi:hypothetical protein